MDELLNKVDHILNDDLIRFKLIKRENEKGKKGNKTTRRKNDEFIKYLVSVATHPIGLRASVNPFNSCQEHMLAFLMDMFELSDNKIKKMLSGNETGVDKDERKKINKIGPTTVDSQPVIDTRKRHSWRPELRVRLNAPTFFCKQSNHLSNLYIRVYLFKDEQNLTIGDNTTHPTTTAKAPENKQDPISDQTDAKSRGILNKIFKRFQLNPSILIRPVNEMRCLLRFRLLDSSSGTTTSDGRASHKLIQVVGGKTSIVEDVYLQIRRYYCEPGTNHILRFEFWLDNQHTKSSFIERFRHIVRRLVYNGCLYCCRAGNRSTYRNVKQELYGYINIKMTQLPSYPIKQNYPVLSLHERKVNNCEMSIDLRNRRIQGENKFQLLTEENNLRDTKTEDNHIMSHLRLYTNSMLYHCLNLSQTSFDSLYRDEAYQNITIDNLFYLPAYGLINQHRLQSNLSRFEDQSLRRISFLLLLIKLNQYISDSDVDSRFNGLMILLISVLQSEYMVAHRIIDDKTMQDIDPFQDATHSSVLKLELATLEKLIKLFLPNRLKEWLLNAESKRTTHRLRLSITLHSLRMFKSAISNLKKCIRTRRLSNQLQTDLLNLKSQVNQLLSEMILVHIRTDIENIAYLDSKTPRKQKKSSQKMSIPAILTNQDGDSSWAQLLYKINCVNHDLSLFWSRRGLDGLISGEMEFVNNLNVFDSLERRSFRKIVEDKIDNYLR